MLSRKIFKSTVLLIIGFLLAACGYSTSQTVNSETGNNRKAVSGNMNESTAKNIEVKTDIETLEKKINLPVRPLEAKWAEEIFDNSKGLVPGPSDYRLTVLLKYDRKSANELTEKLSQKITDQSLGNTEVKSWFPDEVKTQAQTNDGKTYLEGAKYSPEDFFRSPYLNGNLTRIGNSDYFVLNLFSF